MRFENLRKDDVILIKNAILENAISLTTDALENKDTMTTEIYEKCMSDSYRLIYLISVLEDKIEYDK